MEEDWKWSWLNITHNPCFYIEGLRENHKKNLSQDNKCHVQDWNWEHSKYTSELLPLQPNHSVIKLIQSIRQNCYHFSQITVIKLCREIACRSNAVGGRCHNHTPLYDIIYIPHLYHSENKYMESCTSDHFL